MDNIIVGIVIPLQVKVVAAVVVAVAAARIKIKKVAVRAAKNNL